MEEDEGKKAESEAEKRRGKWRRRWRTDINGRGAEDGHIDTRMFMLMLLVPPFLVERDEEREWREREQEQEQWAAATAIFASLLEKRRLLESKGVWEASTGGGYCWSLILSSNEDYWSSPSLINSYKDSGNFSWRLASKKLIKKLNMRDYVPPSMLV